MNARTLAAIAVTSIHVIGCNADPALERRAAAPMNDGRHATPRALLDRVRPSLVVVRYTYDGEVGRREIEGAGIVVREDGLIAFSDGIVPAQIPDAQMIDFKVVVPAQTPDADETELDATFLGRDERADLAYVKVDDAARKWTPLAPADAPLEVGDRVTSVGLLPKSSGYAAYARSSTISAKLRGPVPLVLTDGDLAAVGSPVLDAGGKFVAIVPEFAGQNPLLNPDGADETAALVDAPLFIVPVSDFLPSLNDPPTAPNARKVPWLGVVQMTGLKKDVAEVFGLKGKPAIQIGEVIDDAAAAKAGLKGGEIITQLNGADLERGDTPEELPIILGRKIGRLNVGDQVTLGVIRKKGDAAEPVTVTLGERPPAANTAARFYAEDLGYTVRDLVFQDRYRLRVEPSFAGVIVTFVKQQGNASAGGLRGGDVVTKLNAIDVKNAEQFKTAYEDFRKASAKDAVVLEVLRGVDTQIIRIQPPQ